MAERRGRGGGGGRDAGRQAARRAADGTALYNAEWSRVAAAFRRAHPLCVACPPWAPRAAEVVDHIRPVSERPPGRRADHLDHLFWDEANFQPLCRPCHAAKTERDHAGARAARRAAGGAIATRAEVRVIVGPPASGKCQAARAHAGLTGLVIDLSDAIQRIRLGLPPGGAVGPEGALAPAPPPPAKAAKAPPAKAAKAPPLPPGARLHRPADGKTLAAALEFRRALLVGLPNEPPGRRVAITAETLEQAPPLAAPAVEVVEIADGPACDAEAKRRPSPAWWRERLAAWRDRAAARAALAEAEAAPREPDRRGGVGGVVVPFPGRPRVVETAAAAGAEDLDRQGRPKGQRGGRPPALSPPLADALLTTIKGGVPAHEAARVHGVPETTWRRWRAHGHAALSRFLILEARERGQLSPAAAAAELQREGCAPAQAKALLGAPSAREALPLAWFEAHLGRLASGVRAEVYREMRQHAKTSPAAARWWLERDPQGAAAPASAAAETGAPPPGAFAGLGFGDPAG